MKKYIYAFVIVVGVVSVWLVIQNRHLIPPARPMVSPTPALYEITIPALRARTYHSTLGAKTLYESHATYTSYLTSYVSDTFTINGLLTIPQGVMPSGGWPAIVFVHGYIPPHEYTTTSRYVAYVDYLASRGFAVFKIDLRGNGNSQGQAQGVYYSADYVIDTLNAYAALQSSSFVNPRRIGLWGHSMGGNVVMRSFAVRPTIPAVVIWAGAVYTYEDLRAYRIHDTSYQHYPDNTSPTSLRNFSAISLYGEPNLKAPFWREMAPTTYLTDLKGAIQLNHAVDDPVVSIEYSRNLNKLLDQTSVIHELHEYPTGGHNITDPSFTDAMNNTVRFYQKHL